MPFIFFSLGGFVLTITMCVSFLAYEIFKK